MSTLDQKQTRQAPTQARAVVTTSREQLFPTCRVSRFRPAEGGAEEVHLFIEPDRPGSFDEQLARLVELYEEALLALGLERETAVFRRCYLSDAANQLSTVMSSPLGLAADEAVAVSCLEQAPLPYLKVAMMAYHVSDVTAAQKTLTPVPGAGAEARNLRVARDRHSLLFTTQMTVASKPGEPCCCDQTKALFDSYREVLREHGATLYDHVVRTWLFVHDVDNNYAGLVEARRDLFEEEGLTAATHYIVSTGIEGRTERAECLVMLDSLALPQMQPEQLTYIDALEHLNRTSDYGVTFERAARLDHRDRSHLLISGTASIDASGDVVHDGDVLQQTERTLENIRALLEAGGAEMSDIASMTVYLRDAADALAVRELLDKTAPTLPFCMVHAPVCRPGWLIEIEAIAIVANDDQRWPLY